MNKILVLTTGGIIDKVYFDAKSHYQVSDSVGSAVFQSMNVAFEFSVEEICKKDGLEITDDDRALLLERISASNFRHILITHGTDTMVDTANCLDDQQERVIVFTGAMQPAVFRETDGAFNLGTALGVLGSAKPGVYIAMNGCAYTPQSVLKNYQTHRF
ncbi:MAG: L-asparaginase [Lentisphaeria bacterium]|jgi:L-asparaginase